MGSSKTTKDKDNQRLDILLVTDEAQHAILELHTESKKITTFYQNNVMSAFWPKMITQHSLTGDLYLTVQSMIYRINYTSRRLRYIAGSSALGFADGSFPKARFNHPTGILLVDEGKTILVADQPNGSVRMLYTEPSVARNMVEVLEVLQFVGWTIHIPCWSMVQIF